MISALILTRNESPDLPGCLRSLAGCNDIHVFDSGSEDDTCGIALAFGAQVYVRAFDGYASQRNAALADCHFKYGWVLILDADERLPAGAFGALQAAVAAAPASVAGFRMRRRDHLDGRWLKHAQMTPLYIRLFRKGKGRYFREINEVLELDGDVRDLAIHFCHYPFSKGLAHWLQRHVRYAEREALRWREEQQHSLGFSWRKALFARDLHIRRYHQKGLYYRMPCRPLLKWGYLVLVRRGFLDGRAGLRYAYLQAMYESWIVAFAREGGRQRERTDLR